MTQCHPLWHGVIPYDTVSLTSHLVAAAPWHRITRLICPPETSRPQGSAAMPVQYRSWQYGCSHWRRHGVTTEGRHKSNIIVWLPNFTTFALSYGTPNVGEPLKPHLCLLSSEKYWHKIKNYKYYLQQYFLQDVCWYINVCGWRPGPTIAPHPPTWVGGVWQYLLGIYPVNDLPLPAVLHCF